MTPELPAYRVLLEDDEPAIRDILSSVLKEEGLEAHEARDGTNGLTKLRDRLPIESGGLE
jgi:CheY-like chemotaxis protein